MKRGTYGASGAGRGLGAPKGPKAPLPFTLPSMKREAGEGTQGAGIAAAGAKWASPRPSADMPHAYPPPSDAPAEQAPPAWGGAGLRKSSAEPPPPTPPSQPPAHAQVLLHAPPPPEVAVAAAATATAPAVAPLSPPVAQDWGEDDDPVDLAALALPDIPMPQLAAPPPPQPQPPSVWGAPPRAPAVSLAPHGGPNVGGAPPRPAAKIAAELRIVEEQKDRMKAKAESAQEAWRRAEEERERLRVERAAEKLRALELKMSSASPPVRVDPNAWRSAMVPNGSSGGASAPSSAQTEPPRPVAPKVLLRRPAAPRNQASGEALATARASAAAASKGDAARPQRKATRQPTRNGTGAPAAPYDGPLDNETREQWLNRRRRETEARDAARFVIEMCIDTAVYGPSRGRRRRGGGRSRAKAGNYAAAGPGEARPPLPELALPQTMNPFQDAVLVPTASSSPATSTATARADRQTTSRAGNSRHWTKGPVVALAAPVSSPGTRTVESVVDAVVGDEAAPRRKTKKRGGRNERIKRERREQMAAQRAAEKSAHIAAAVAPPPLPPRRRTPARSRTVVAGPYVHKVLPSAGRGAGVVAPTAARPPHPHSRNAVTDADAWANRAAQPRTFDDISRAFSNSKGGFSLVGAPIIPTVPIIPPSTTVAPQANGNSSWPSPAWPAASEELGPKWLFPTDAPDDTAASAHIPTVPLTDDAPLPRPKPRRRKKSNKPKTEVKDAAAPTALAEDSDPPPQSNSHQSPQQPEQQAGGKRPPRSRNNRPRKQSENEDEGAEAAGTDAQMPGTGTAATKPNRHRRGGRGRRGGRKARPANAQVQAPAPTQSGEAPAPIAQGASVQRNGEKALQPMAVASFVKAE